MKCPAIYQAILISIYMESIDRLNANYIFADTSYWIALYDPRDGLRAAALAKSKQHRDKIIVTSEFIILEFLTICTGKRRHIKKKARIAYDEMMSNERVIVVPCSAGLFKSAVERYDKYEDKEWSIVDCASFEIMEDYGMNLALTGDRHFEQASFVAELRSAR